MKKVAVIVLNYKVKDLTMKCLLSVKSSDYPDLDIIVVDNGSEDGIEEELRKQKGIIFIQTGSNLGYTGGNNIGIKHALENEAQYLFVLNPDTEVARDTISELVKVAEKENAGIVGPKILFSDKKTIWYAGGQFDMLNVLGGHRGVDEKDVGQYDKMEETDYITGAAILVKKEVFARIGLFENKYFLYYEDSDFCMRAKRAGFKILYVPQAAVYHVNAKSTGLGSPLQDYYITRNRMLFASNFLPLRTKLALFREAVRNLGQPIRRKAFLDFLTGSFGKGSL